MTMQCQNSQTTSEMPLKVFKGLQSYGTANSVHQLSLRNMVVSEHQQQSRDEGLCIMERKQKPPLRADSISQVEESLPEWKLKSDIIPTISTRKSQKPAGFISFQEEVDVSLNLKS